MMVFFDALGPAIWRATWQAAVLAVLVSMVLRCCGERLAPRWRFLLWGIVLTRLLLVATPASPWSAFNLARWSPDKTAPRLDPHEPAVVSIPTPAAPLPESRSATAALPLVSDPAPAESVVRRPSGVGERGILSAKPETMFDVLWLARIGTGIWLIGCCAMALKLLATAMILRRRLSACRSVTDPSLMQLLQNARQKLGLRQTPALLVTPESLSPCLVGTWRPRVVLPESVLTQPSTARLRHVLAHELAHLVRGDLWTNWLLLAVRVLHWFNPVAWWTVREMQAEREAACDERAFAVLGDTERSEYAATIVELATHLSPSPLAPGFIGLFSSTCRLKARVERLVRSPSVRTLRAPLAVGLLLGTALLGLTDAMPNVLAQAPKKEPAPPAPQKDAAEVNNHTESGRVFEDGDRRPLAGITVRLYRAEGRTAPPVEVASTVTDAEGRYVFTGLVPPRIEHQLDRLVYGVFGFAADRPVGISFFHFDKDNKKVVTVQMSRQKATLAGKVVDTAGRPVAGAKVFPCFVFDRPLEGLLSATTDAEGRFQLEGLGVFTWRGGKDQVATHFDVVHPDFPSARGEAKTLPADVVFTLPAGCVVSGTVTDSVTKQPAVGTEVIARRSDSFTSSAVATDARGRFRMVLKEGRYDFLAEARDRVSVALTGRECQVGENVELPAFTLIGGGFISGQVVNTATGKPETVSEFGGPIMLGLYGPSQPQGHGISPVRLAGVDKDGRFTLRAAPGENFPYFVNIRGNRMAWDTLKQPAVVVKEGETTSYNMLITPEVQPEVKLREAKKVVDALSKSPADRTAGILLEFRKLKHTVDETELWCLLMRELVAVGPAAVPQLCAELDQTSDDRTLRRLGFALRAIGDPRAVPALIRAIPRTLLPSSSDFGLNVTDQDLMAFMKAHDLDKGQGGAHFGFGRPGREIVGALHTLTRQDFNDSEVLSLSLSEDPRRQVFQRRVILKQAQRWQAWWEANWQTLTKDAAYQKVNLTVADTVLPPAPDPQALGKTARLVGEWREAVISPAIQEPGHAWHFYDIDAGVHPQWPAHIPRNEGARDTQKLAAWMAQTGVDLMCVTHTSADGTDTFVLRAIGMQLREITDREYRNLDKSLAAGRLPEGRPVGELLMHFDPQSEQLVPNANGVFLFTTAEGNLGLIETTDRVTRTADLTGLPSGSSPGVGFHKGVRFNLKAIVP